MIKFVVVLAGYLAIAAAGIVHPVGFAAAPAPAVAAPLYAAGGSQQIDVRHNYDGSLSSYTTTPFGYTSPISSRYVAGGPAVFPGYVSPAGYAASALAPAAYAAPAHLVASANYVAGPFTTPLTAPLAAAPPRVIV